MGFQSEVYRWKIFFEARNLALGIVVYSPLGAPLPARFETGRLTGRMCLVGEERKLIGRLLNGAFDPTERCVNADDFSHHSHQLRDFAIIAATVEGEFPDMARRQAGKRVARYSLRLARRLNAE